MRTNIAKPNFFIVGAPKSGTTSLSTILNSHPNVFMSAVKEPHYFNSDMGNRKYTDLPGYLALFRSAGIENIRIGEASTWYLFSDVAIPNIEKEFPDARYIVCLRNPVEMAWSLFIHNIAHQNESELNFETAWRLGEYRSKKTLPRTCKDARLVQYKTACSVGTQLQRLLSRVDRSRVHIVVLDDLNKNQTSSIAKVLEFLDLPHSRELPIKTRLNSAAEMKYGVLDRTMRYAVRIKSRIGLPPFNLGIIETIRNANTEANKSDAPLQFLNSVVAKDMETEIALLAEILRRDLSSWRGRI